MKWQKGIAFIRGMNMFAENQISKGKMLELCKKVETKNIKIVQLVKTDNVIFKKRIVHYATVGSLLEKTLSKYFNKRVFVTTRSFNTLNKCLN